VDKRVVPAAFGDAGHTKLRDAEYAAAKQESVK